MAKNSTDLVNIFQAVTQALAENQQTLDQADTYNHDHGSNMVQTFQTITNALEQKKSSSNSTALAYAAKRLSKTASSSSGKLYAENLNTAADHFKGRQMDERGALELLQTLIGSSQGGQQAAGGGDMLGTLLSGMAGNAAPQQQAPAAGDDMLGMLLGGMAGNAAPQQQAPAAGDDMLGMLLGGLTGGGAPAAQPQPQAPAGGDMLGMLLGGLTGAGQQGAQGTQGGQAGQGEIGLDDLLAGGLAYLQAKQSGQGTMQALIQALAAGSGMGNSSHRTESTQVVIQAFLQALSAMNKPK